MIGALLLFATVALGLGALAGRWSSRPWLLLTLAGTAALAAAGLAVGTGLAPDWDWRSAFTLGGQPLHLRLDGLSALFLVLLAGVGAAGTAYAFAYPIHTHASDHGAPARGRFWWNGLLFHLGFVLVNANGLHFLIGWELFTVCAYFLIVLDRRKWAVRQAGWLYLAASHAGTVALFAFFALLASATGSWDLGPLRTRTDLAPLFWLALFGFGLKAGLFPLHVWLPSAHANAPGHVSALLSGVAIKMGVYGLLRFSGWLPVPASAGWVVLGLGALGTFAGIVFALVQTDLKRLLAYCSVENIGIILIGLGAALLAPLTADGAWGRLALAGALLHTWNHGFAKALLFLGAGAVAHATGTREMTRLGGLWRGMPVTTLTFLVGAASMAGLPPLAGFAGEWLIYLGLFEAVVGHGPAGWAAGPAVMALALAGALALATFIKAGGLVFLGTPHSPAVAGARDPGGWMRGPLIALAVLVMLLGLVPFAAAPLLARAAGAWRPLAEGVTASAPPLATLARFHLLLAAVLLAGGVVLWRRTRAQGVTLGPTWDCGYAQPSRRMHYTAGGFSGTIGGWFTWFLRPARSLRRPHGPFPDRAFTREDPRETVLEDLVRPTGAGVLRISTAVRRLQHGRLQSYILYILIGVGALGLIVLFHGGRS